MNYRNPSSGELERDGRTLQVKVDGPLIGSDGELGVRAAIDGIGLTIYYDGEIVEHVDAGRLVRVITKWCPPFPGYQISYPSQRHVPPALAALVTALRKRARSSTG